MAKRWKTAAHSHGEQNEHVHFSCLIAVLPPVPFPITVMLRLLCIAVVPTGQRSSQPGTAQQDDEEAFLWLRANSLMFSAPQLHPSTMLFQLSGKHKTNF